MKAIVLIITCTLLTFVGTAQDPNYTVNGNLGIGTTPTHKLSVEGDSKMTGELTVTEKAKLEGEVEMTGDVKLTGLSTTGTGFERLLYLDDDGKIQKAQGEMFYNLLFEFYNQPCVQINNIFQPIWNNDVNKLYVHNSCGYNYKVGIGTSNPTARLHIKGVENGYQLKIQSQTALNKAFTVTSNNMDNFIVNGGGNISIFNQLAQNSAFNISNDSGTDVFRVMGGGSISIYNQLFDSKSITVVDDAGLDVFRVMGNGKVYTTEVSVRLKEDFPDYVFEEDYKLMSLHDLEQYIKTNKRLPNMPSADKVATDGLDIGESNRLLTEKVEELTLYILQLKAELDALKVQTEAIQNTTK